MVRHSIAFIAIILSFAALGQRKSDRVTLIFDNADLETIFDSLSAQTGYFFSYNSEVLPSGSKYAISANDEPIDQFLSNLLVGTNLSYAFFRDQIIIKYEPPEQPVVRRRKFFNLSGQVVDETGEALQGVNVFLDGTSLGISTDIDGNYLLEDIPPGSYDLVFSYVGYQKAVYSLAEYNGGARIQRHQMIPSIEELEEVAIVSERISTDSDRWMVYFQQFQQDLFGSSENAGHCRITNPEAIKFSYDEVLGKLKAYASEPIQIDNEAMAYKITYYLESYERTDNDLRYRGRIRFQNNYQPVGRFTRREVRRERKKSYLGSFNHFKKALLGADLRKEGFRIYRSSSSNKVRFKKLDERAESDIITFKGTKWELDFAQYLLCVYTKERESLNFLRDSNYAGAMYEEYIDDNNRLNRSPGKQASFIQLLERPVRLDLNGQVLDKFAITTYGYWSWERLANLVPINYDPKFDNF